MTICKHCLSSDHTGAVSEGVSSVCIVFHKDALNNAIIIRSPLNEASVFSNFSEKKKKFSSWRIFSYFDANCDRIAETKGSGGTLCRRCGKENRMEYKRFGSTVVARIDRGEEVLSALKDIALRENIKLAAVSALGATDDFTVGVFNVQQKQYHANRFQGAYEIVSLTGTVTTKDGEFYAHLHMCAGNEQGQAFGGHLNQAVISATCEMVIQIIDGTVERRFSGDVGLNLFRF